MSTPQQQYQTPSADEFLMGGGGAPTAKFPTIGTSVGGRITEKPFVQQQRDIDSGEPKFWNDGKPMMQLVVTVQTNQSDPSIQDKTAPRRVFTFRCVESFDANFLLPFVPAERLFSDLNSLFSTFNTITVLFNHRIRQDFAGNLFHLGLSRRSVQTLLEGEDKVLTLPHIGDILVLHPRQGIRNGLPLCVEHRTFQRDIDIGLHLA